MASLLSTSGVRQTTFFLTPMKTYALSHFADKNSV
jgi:hypothetical protein